MPASDTSLDEDLRQTRLSKFGRVLAGVTLGYVGLTTATAIWVERPSFNLTSVPLLVATAAFGALWLLLRGAPRSKRFVRVVEVASLFVGTTALASMAPLMDLTSSPDMIVRSALTYVLLVYAVYVPSTAHRTLLVAALMTVPLLGGIYLAFSQWDPALHDPPAAIWRKGNKGDMALPATLVSAFLWLVVVGIAAGFSQTVHGLRKTVRAIRKLGQYTLEQKLGEGGMGVVYRASHGMLRRPTAVKLLLPERAGSAALARFEREVRRTAALTHPNTITVYDYGRTAEGVFYYAMELLEGASLDEIIEVNGPQPEGRVIHLLEQAAGSLAEAHAAGLIHRDVKPANVLVVDRGGIADLVKVVDFGLVKDVSEREQAAPDPSLTAADAITGTPLYMAPEAIVSPDAVDARTDIYALGAVGYWLLTGTHVFSGNTIVEVCAHHLHSAPEPPSERVRRPVSPDLEQLLLQCLEKRAEARPASMRLLRERLRACAEANAWSQERAAAWWSDHRHELRSGGAQQRPSTPAAAQLLTVTRLA